MQETNVLRVLNSYDLDAGSSLSKMLTITSVGSKGTCQPKLDFGKKGQNKSSCKVDHFGH